MGTIQNSINGALGTVAGAAALGKHVAEQKKANELAGMKAAEEAEKEIASIVAENTKVMEEYSDVSAELKNKNAELKDLKANAGEIPGMGTPAGGDEATQELNKDVKALRTAKKALKDKQDAMVMQVKEQMEKIAQIRKAAGLKGAK